MLLIKSRRFGDFKGFHIQLSVLKRCNFDIIFSEVWILMSGYLAQGTYDSKIDDYHLPFDTSNTLMTRKKFTLAQRIVHYIQYLAYENFSHWTFYNY